MTRDKTEIIAELENQTYGERKARVKALITGNGLYVVRVMLTLSFGGLDTSVNSSDLTEIRNTGKGSCSKVC